MVTFSGSVAVGSGGTSVGSGGGWVGAGWVGSTSTAASVGRLVAGVAHPLRVNAAMSTILMRVKILWVIFLLL